MTESGILLYPPDDGELDQLDQFLRTRADDDSLLLDGVHGLLTALAIGPSPAAPDEWLPEVLAAPFRDEHEGGTVLGLLAKLNDSISLDLASDEYTPILGEYDDEEAARISAAGWCEGFSRGIDLRAGLWESRMAEDPELMEMLSPIMALGLEDGVFHTESEIQRLSENDYHAFLHQIPDAVAALHHYWRVHPLSTLEQRAASSHVEGNHTLH